MTRWVPSPERRERPRLQESPSTSLGAGPVELQAYRTLLDPRHKPNGRGWQLVRQGAMGLALVGVAGWLLKSASAKAVDRAGGASLAEKDRQ
jgi:hypothetical protein